MREVHVVVTRSTFWMRLRLHARLFLARLPWLVVGALVLPFLFWLLTLAVDGELFGVSRGRLFLYAAAGCVGLTVLLVLGVAVGRSVGPSPLERHLPRALTFRVDGLTVVPRDRPAYETSWHWLERAVDRGATVDLVIGTDPLLVVTLASATLGEDRLEQIRIWLRRNDKLPRRPA
ncbi:MAG: hypothetical protein IT373_15850 [Polyangiaceae bacterium]|nr:hypothetical protein [Polyangiaceae bacterium]